VAEAGELLDPATFPITAECKQEESHPCLRTQFLPCYLAGAALPAAEAGELLELLGDKGVACRTDAFEVKLAVAGEAAGLAA